MDSTEYLPPVALLSLFSLFGIFRFENQRWVRARRFGLRGSSELPGILVDLTAGVALVFSILFLSAVGYDWGWRAAIGLLCVAVVVTIVYSIVSSLIFGGDSWIAWMGGTLGTWIMLAVLFPLVTWFGMFG